MTYQPLISHRVVIRTWPDRSLAVGEALAGLVTAARALAGCVAIDASRHPEDTRLWHLSMCWANEQAMGRWLAGPAAELFGNLVAQYHVVQIDFQPGAALAAGVSLRRAG